MFLRRAALRMFSPTARRRACATTFLGLYLVGAIGFPVEFPTVVDASTPFPCQGHRCGCRSAEQCWRQCCCFTREQKLAWARAHGVTPPEQLLAAAEESHEQLGHEHGPAGHEPAPHKHCAHDHNAQHKHAAQRSGSIACRSTTTPATTDCTSSGRCRATAASQPAAAACGHCSSSSGQKQSSSVVMMEALKCQGLATYWCSVGAVVPPPPTLTWQFDWTCQERVSLHSERLPLLSGAPPEPPPRV